VARPRTDIFLTSCSTMVMQAVDFPNAGDMNALLGALSWIVRSAAARAFSLPFAALCLWWVFSGFRLLNENLTGAPQ